VTAVPLLSVRDLRVEFGSPAAPAVVVDDVSFELGADEVLALVGESGSGKSVTALAILGLLDAAGGRIAHGEILFDGQDLRRLGRRQMQRIRGGDIAMIFQEPMSALNPTLTIRDQIAEVLEERGLSRRAAGRRVVELLEKVRISDPQRRANAYPHQRAMIAMALACSPRLLIADEPTTALDVTIQAQILDLLATLRAENDMAVLFITHDMGVVAETADRMVVMQQGRVVESGPTEQIFAAPVSAYTRTLLRSVPRLGELAATDHPVRFAMAQAAVVAADRPVPRPAAELSRPLLTVEGLTTRFDIVTGMFGRVVSRVHAVENVSFTLQAGETLALVGESGWWNPVLARCALPGRTFWAPRNASSSICGARCRWCSRIRFPASTRG
jgi:ABC-type glutathione transport system ATPase component